MAGKAWKQSTQIKKIFFGNVEQKKVYFKDDEVFSSAHIVFFHIDVDNVVSYEVDDETNIYDVAPVATKDGWTYAGWRTDQEADLNVPTVIPATEDNMHVYAVFKKSATLRVTIKQVLYTYPRLIGYNNGTYSYPVVYVDDPEMDEASFLGYSDDPSSINVVTVTLADGIELRQDEYRYAVWKYDDKNLSDTTISRTGLMGPQTITMFTLDGTKFVNLEVTIQTFVVVAGWAVQCNSLVHLRGYSGWREDVVLHNTRGDLIGTFEEGPCANRATPTLITEVDNEYPYALTVTLSGDVPTFGGDSSWVKIYRIDGIGRTVVY